MGEVGEGEGRRGGEGEGDNGTGPPFFRTWFRLWWVDGCMDAVINKILRESTML